MKRIALLLLIVSLSWVALAAQPTVCVLDGPDILPMKDSLKRIKQPFTVLEKLDAGELGKHRVLIVCGTKPPVDERGKEIIEGFLKNGGHVLAIGGGATCMMQHRLFDAEGYYLTGTTVHMTVFHGYHRLTFGYPGVKPFDGWKSGVPNLLRATEGPLMILGPKATSILGYDSGGLYSAAAFQRVGQGLLLLIGPDPQGGNAYYELEKPRLEPGSKLQTERMLANAIAFLLDPHTNLIPNSGFEENTEPTAWQSNWLILLRDGATKQWRRDGAPEGRVFLKLVCPQAKSMAIAQPYRPIVVERGRSYEFRCMYKATIPWEFGFSLLKGKRPSRKPESMRPLSVQPSSEWKRFMTRVSVPPDVSYLKPVATLRGKGELCLDDVTLRQDN
ncbi:MAG: hypothetical protein GXP25_10745 [Planctomycetes bacterium]|nr:hypothetical protein [Planctomycetota bacterium]